MITILAILALAVGVFLFLAWQPQYRNLGVQQLPDVIRELMVIRENGGYYKLKFRNGGQWISVERVDGSDTSAKVAIRIPRGMVSDEKIADVRDTLAAIGFDWLEQSDSYSLVAIAALVVDDIWPKDSGVGVSMAIMSILDASDVSVPVCFDVEAHGKVSTRRYQH